MPQSPSVGTGTPSRELPQQRPGAPAPGQKRRRYLRWKRTATAVTLLVLAGCGLVVVLLIKGPQEDAGQRAARALLQDLGRAIEAHHARVGRLPARISELLGPNSPYQGDALPEDAYRSPIEYRVLDGAAGTYRLRSLGADGRPGSTDDLVWPEGLQWE